MDALKKANKELDEASGIAMQLGFYRTIIALCRYGWKRLRLERFMDKANEVYLECRKDDGKSLVQMCDEETGIEVRNEEGESYLDTTYLNQAKWDVEKAKFDKMPYPMQRAYYISVRQHMKKWMYAQIMASIILALHRKEGWSFDRISAFLSVHDEIKAEFGNDIEKLNNEVYIQTNMKYIYNGEDLILLDKQKGVTT